MSQVTATALNTADAGLDSAARALYAGCDVIAAVPVLGPEELVRICAPLDGFVLCLCSGQLQAEWFAQGLRRQNQEVLVSGSKNGSARLVGFLERFPSKGWIVCHPGNIGSLWRVMEANAKMFACFALPDALPFSRSWADRVPGSDGLLEDLLSRLPTLPGLMCAFPLGGALLGELSQAGNRPFEVRRIPFEVRRIPFDPTGIELKIEEGMGHPSLARRIARHIREADSSSRAVVYVREDQVPQLLENLERELGPSGIACNVAVVGSQGAKGVASLAAELDDPRTRLVVASAPLGLPLANVGLVVVSGIAHSLSALCRCLLVHHSGRLAVVVVKDEDLLAWLRHLRKVSFPETSQVMPVKVVLRDSPRAKTAKEIQDSIGALRHTHQQLKLGGLFVGCADLRRVESVLEAMVRHGVAVRNGATRYGMTEVQKVGFDQGLSQMQYWLKVLREDNESLERFLALGKDADAESLFARFDRKHRT